MAKQAPLYSGADPATVAADLAPLVEFTEQGLSPHALRQLVEERLLPHLMQYGRPQFQSMFNAFPSAEAQYGAEVARNIAAVHARTPPLDLTVKSDADGWAQRLGGIGTTVHVPLLLAVIGLREQPSHQLDEHRDRIIGELLSKLYDLCNDQGVPATCVEVVGQPCRSCVALTDHLIPPSRRYARLHFRIDPQPTQKPDPFGQSDQVRRARRFWRRP